MTMTKLLIAPHAWTKKPIIILFLVFCLFSICRAWNNVGIGGGGAQFAPSFSYLDHNLLFLQCDMGGVYRSIDNGASFQILDFTIFGSSTDYPNACPIAYDPNNVNRLWSFGGQNDDTGGSLLVSNDEGLNWSYANPQPDLNGNGNYIITRIVVDRGNSNLILLGTDNGAFYTNNGGAGWNLCAGITGYVYGIVIDQSSPAGNRACYIGSDAGVFKSTNNGANFTAANTGIPGAALTGFSGASIASPAALVLYAVYNDNSADYGDIYRSTNGAANWAMAQAGSVTDGFYEVECAESNTTTVYCLNNAQGDTEGVWKSADSGSTWNNVFTPSTSGGNVALGWIDYDILFQEGSAWIQIKVDPVDPNRVVATDLDTTYMSTNGGTSWSQIYSNFADTPPVGAGKKWTTRGLEVTTVWNYYINPWSSTTHYICQTDIGLQRSTDSGNTWYHSLPFSVTWHNTIYEMVFDQSTQTIYAAASSQHDIPHSTQIRVAPGAGGVIKSTNNGVSWAGVSTGLPGTPATSILRDPATGNLYAAVWGNSNTNGGVFMSGNNGATWSSMNTGLGNAPNFHACQLKQDTGGNLYCLISGYNVGGTWVSGGIWKYLKSGTSWSCLTANADGGQPLYYLQGFDIDPVGNTIYAASMKWGTPTQKGLYRSFNGGTNWTHLTLPATANDFDGFCPSINPANLSDVYFGTENQGLWETLDAGNTWNRVAGIPFRSNHRVFFDTSNGDQYLCTDGNSVWKNPAGTATNTPVSSPSPTSTAPGATSTRTNTFTATPTATGTRTPSPTASASPSASETGTSTDTVTRTVTPSNSATITETLTITETNTPVPPGSTNTDTPTVTPTFTETFVNTATRTGTMTQVVSFTYTRTLTQTPVFTPTNTPTQAAGGQPLAFNSCGIYPNPFNYGAGQYLNIAIDLSKIDIDGITLEIYSMSFRKVRAKHLDGVDARLAAASGIMQYGAAYLKGMGAGVYYYVVTAERGGEKTRSRADVLILMRGD
jgi:hypothetical protein